MITIPLVDGPVAIRGALDLEHTRTGCCTTGSPPPPGPSSPTTTPPGSTANR